MAKILIVEDNEMNRDMLSRRLEKSGYQVLIAVDGQEAIEMTKKEMPDLILMDMSLPVMNGWDATKRIKADENTRNIPIIALTAHALLEDLRSTLEAGCDDYDSKPVDYKRLTEKIKKLLPGK